MSDRPPARRAVPARRRRARPTERRLSVVSDVEGYSLRTNPQAEDLQTRLLWCMDRSFEAAGVPPRREDCQDRGDGQLRILPAGTDEGRAVPTLLSAMQEALFQVNRLPGPGGRMRLRLAMAQGLVTVADTGFVGQSVKTACSLVDSDASRTVLAGAPDSDLVVVVPDDLYQDVLAQEYGGPRAADFRRMTVEVPSSESFSAVAWVYTPDPGGRAAWCRRSRRRRCGRCPPCCGRRACCWARRPRPWLCRSAAPPKDSRTPAAGSPPFLLLFCLYCFSGVYCFCCHGGCPVSSCLSSPCTAMPRRGCPARYRCPSRPGTHRCVARAFRAGVLAAQPVTRAKTAGVSAARAPSQ